MRLSQKTLILVLVPVAFELIFVGWLYISLSEIEKQAEQAEEARVLATHISRFTRSIVELVGKKKYDVHGEAPVDAGTGLRSMQSELNSIEDLVKNRPAELKLVRKIKALVTETVILGNSLTDCTKSGDIVRAYEMRDKIRPLLDNISANVELLRKTQEKLEESAPHVISQRRKLIRNILVLGISMNVGLAIMLALIVNRGLVFRLGILYDNAKAFEQNQPLRPAPDGHDEIATVDSAFRQMANSLALAREREKLEKERLKQIIHGLPLGLAMVDDDGTIAMSNDALANLIHHSNLSGVRLQTIFEDPVDVHALSGNSQQNILKADGKTFPAEVGVTFIDTTEGRKALVLIVDQSERLAIEQMKQQFVAVVSHELRTPLTTVQNFLQMIKEGIYGKISDSGLETLRGVDTGVERLIRLTRDLLDVERLESGHLQLEIIPCELSRIFSDSLHAVSGASAKANAEIVVPKESVTVKADSERIVQVLSNLLSNAIKFTPDGGKIEVRLSHDETEAKIEVVDSGPGIAPEFHEKIFDRFQQVNVDDSKKRGGSGLGLAICKLIVEQHGGAIGVRSENGNGSTFWFTLPRA